MDVINIIIAIVGTINILLGFLVYLRSKKSSVNISFLLMAVAISLWCFTMFFFRSSANPQSAEMWCRFLYMSAALLTGLFLPFGFLFPTGEFKGVKRKIFIALTIIVLSAGSLIPGLLIREIEIVKNGENIIHFNYPFYTIYIIYIVGMFNWFFAIVLRKYFKGTEVEKQQIKFVIFGNALAVGVGVVTNLILPTIGVFKFNWLGQIFTLSMVAFITYAIIKHHLFNVKMIATEIFLALIDITLLVDALLAKGTTEKVIKLIIFFLMLFFSYLLLKSILKEIKTNEQLELTAKELKSANTELLQLDKAKSEFISIASHQLLTPLTPIRGYSSMLLEEDFGKINEKQEKAIKMIYESSVRLVNLVNDLLDISRIERGAIEYNFTPVDLAELIKSVIEELTPRAKDKKLYLQFVRSEENIPKINADEDKMREVLLNLIDNSIKYSSSGKITIDIKRDGNDVVFGVSDQGIGIKSADMPLLFKKFSRSEDVKHIHVGGSGLGLYVARRHIEAHGGYIWAESPGKGKGSTFFVSLPIAKRRGD